jgi:hypothetical protein
MSLKISSSLFEDELKSSFLNEDLEGYIENVERKDFKDESSTCILKCQKDSMMPFTLNIMSYHKQPSNPKPNDKLNP